VRYYQKDPAVRKILDSKHPIHQKTYLELLRHEQDNAKFKALQDEVTTSINELKAITLKDVLLTNLERVHETNSSIGLTI
ncbi:MAG: hypothetical protein KBD37_06855, partial [Burkholderiales bacterium]|nr:hypothetical protein [Burkholderiales bacterium]